MVFFVEWALWAKMCFVLVLIYGSGVHIYNSVMLKKFTAAAAITRPKPEMIEAGSEEIPFGSRAIESGIEIEGIWISSHNTPVGTPRRVSYSDASRTASAESKSIIIVPPPPPLSNGPNLLSPKAATLARAKPVSVSSPFPHFGGQNSNASSSGTKGRRAQSEINPKHDQQREGPQNCDNNGCSEYDEVGTESAGQHESGYSSMNSRHAENGSVFGTESDFAPIATASENNLYLHTRSIDSEGIFENTSGNGQFRSASGPPYEQTHLNPTENCRIVDDKQHRDLLPLHSRRQLSIAETGQLGNATRSGFVEVHRDDGKDRTEAIVTQISQVPLAQAV
ncbi:uncharacterized protein PADG_01905 [Paracoccidioides brasiliensis Pb18]|uniref:Uncharacterized protein n=1 Tax=Paracoccidioides brasiliensis (strain Pb18) TaxID=502780 RepID=C1G4N9_PARBD|nr:uncharacterized protein PADG_01905 [Paracoccidioides brasiliensis Pb18]EEH45755.1 hypothetical protein PADG_01905 [Paracoccidioides brasiliensis Pb18]